MLIMKQGHISKDYDVVGKSAPSLSQGCDPFDNPGIMPHESPIADTPGERASNSTEPHMSKGGIPAGKKGGGY